MVECYKGMLTILPKASERQRRFWIAGECHKFVTVARQSMYELFDFTVIYENRYNFVEIVREKEYPFFRFVIAPL